MVPCSIASGGDSCVQPEGGLGLSGVPRLKLMLTQMQGEPQEDPLYDSALATYSQADYAAPEVGITCYSTYLSPFDLACPCCLRCADACRSRLDVKNSEYVPIMRCPLIILKHSSGVQVNAGDPCPDRAAAHVWSCGVLLHYMLTGDLPFHLRIRRGQSATYNQPTLAVQVRLLVRGEASRGGSVLCIDRGMDEADGSSQQLQRVAHISSQEQ